MDLDSDAAGWDGGSDGRSRTWLRAQALVAPVVVSAVAVASVMAAVMQMRANAEREARPVTASASGAVVQAPPLTSLSAHARHPARPARSDHMRAAIACAECGVVEAVLPVSPPAPRHAAAYQMRIRMDDGSLRTVEQRGALAAGSRVLVAGGAVHLLPNRGGEG
jgi:hypothetical protein